MRRLGASLIFLCLSLSLTHTHTHTHCLYTSSRLTATASYSFLTSHSFYEITKAGDAVAKLKESLQARATVCRNGKFKEISAVGLVPGDLILLAAGSCVPADCRVNPIGKPGVSLVDVDESYVTVCATDFFGQSVFFSSFSYSCSRNTFGFLLQRHEW